MLERRLSDTLYERRSRKPLRRCLRSKKALTVPITYLMLFASLITIVSATYSFALIKINGKAAWLKASVARQSMQQLDEAISSVAWSFGASRIIYFDDCGGTFRTASSAKNLVLNVTDEQSFHEIVFNSPIGKAHYELEASDSSDDGFFVRGDGRPLANHSAYVMTQLYYGTEGAEQIILCYRPSVTAANVGSSNGKPLNLIRVHIINLNHSRNLILTEKFYLKITSENVNTVTYRYELNNSTSSIALRAVFDGVSATTWLPIISNTNGAVVTLEIVICNVRIQPVEV